MRNKIKLTIILLALSSLSCATFGSYFLLPLNQRQLRISLDGPWTEFRWYKERKCGPLKAFTCWDEMIEKDFDFTVEEHRKKFNDMQFRCSVRQRPE